MRKIRWGILAAGGIARKFAEDLKRVPDAEAVAIGSRSRETAEAFAGEFGIPKAYGSYEELVRDPDVDIVYVASIHNAHKENVLLCLNAGKAVLNEKPFTVSAAETETLIRTARDKGLFLMEAMWTRYLPAIRKVREWIAEGRIGEVRSMHANFGYHAVRDPEGRLLNPHKAGGALLDVGIYPVSFASLVFGMQPERISSHAYIGDTGVDESNAMLFAYPGGRSATLQSAVQLQLDNNCDIYGSKGKIHIPNFWMAKEAVLQTSDGETERFSYDGDRIGYAFEAEEAGRCLREGLTESPDMPLDETLAIMRTMDEIRRQWGLRYPFES
jgi:predicted dehydrogenase